MALQALAWLAHLAMVGPNGVDASRYLAVAERVVARGEPAAVLAGSLAASLLQLPGGVDHGLGGGGGTDTMVAVATALYVATGGSYAAMTLAMGALALAGRWALYRALAELEPRHELPAFLAVFAVPSVGWWSAALGKEALALFGLGLAVHGAVWLRPHGLVGVAVVSLVRAPAAAAACLAAVALAPGTDRARWGRVVGVVAVGLLVAELLPRPLGGWPLSAHLAWQQQAAVLDTARSAAPLVDHVPATLLAQLPHLPVAVFTGLFRPGAWEAHAPLAALAGLENAALLAVCVAALARAERGWWSRPGVVFALVFAAVFAGGIGLVTANLGTLSRHRVLLAPFVWWVALSGVARER